MEKKREGDREAAAEVFLASDPLYHCFFIGDEKGELLKLLLQPTFEHRGALLALPCSAFRHNLYSWLREHARMNP
jgi:hypothetical protein